MKNFVANKTFVAVKGYFMMIPVFLVFIGYMMLQTKVRGMDFDKTLIIIIIVSIPLFILLFAIMEINSLSYDESLNSLKLRFKRKKSYGAIHDRNQYNHNVDLNEVESLEVRLITSDEYDNKVGSMQIGRKFFVFTLKDGSMKFINSTFFTKYQIKEIIKLVNENINKE